MTRVLMTADTVGGVWTYATELADALVAYGVEVVLATMGGPLPAPRAGVHESRYALEWMPDPWDDVDRAGAWLLDLARDVRPDVVHLNGYAHAALPWGVPRVVVAHSDVLSWHRAVRRCEAGPEWDEYRRRIAAGLDAADVVVAPTWAMLAALGRDGVVIPNGRNAGWVRDVPKEPFVLTAGRQWDEAKNIAALERLRLPLAVAGGCLPFGELAGLLNRAAVFALPAKYEPFGLAALEAGLAGCALVLGDIPSLREVWGDAARYADPFDGAAIGRAVRDALADAPALGAAARRRAAAYTPDAMAVAYAATYGRLTSARGAA